MAHPVTHPIFNTHMISDLPKLSAITEFEINGMQIPSELMSKIFDFSDKQSLGRIAQVSKPCKVLSEADNIWNKFIVPGFKYLFDSKKDKKSRKFQICRQAFYRSIGNRYDLGGLGLDKVRIGLSGLPNETMPALLAKEYLDPAAKLNQDVQIKFTYAEALEYVIRKIHFLVNEQKEDDKIRSSEEKVFWFAAGDPRDTALTTIEDDDSDLSEIRNFGYIPPPSKWLEIIFSILTDQKIIQRCEMYPANRYKIIAV